MYLCPTCYLQGYCRKLQARLVTDEELRKPKFIRDLRNFAKKMSITTDRWHDFVIGGYRNYVGSIVDASGKMIELDTDVFDLPSIRYWFKDFACTEPEAGSKLHVRREARERVRVFATILRALNPEATAL